MRLTLASLESLFCWIPRVVISTFISLHLLSKKVISIRVMLSGHKSWRCLNSRLRSDGMKMISVSIMFHRHSDSRILWLKYGRLTWFLFILNRSNQLWLVLKHSSIGNLKSISILLLIPLLFLNVALYVAQIVIHFHFKLHLLSLLLQLFLSSIKVKIL